MSDETIRVIYVQAEKEAEIREIEATLEAMQALVDGPIRELMPFEDEVVLVCNAEGTMRQLPYSRLVEGDDGETRDVIAGNFFMCYAPVDSEEYMNFPPDLEEKYLRSYRYSEEFYLVDGEIRAEKLIPDRERSHENDAR